MAIQRRRWCGAAVLCALCMASTGAAAQDEGADTEAGGEASAEASAEGSLELGGGLDPESGLGADVESGMGDEGSGIPGTGPALEGALRLGLSLVVVDFSSLSRENDTAGERSSSDFNFGVRNSALGAIVGYGITPELQVGLRLTLNVLSGSDENTPPPPAPGSVKIDRSGFELGALPFVEYVFDMPSETTRLFALATIGIRTQSQSNTVSDQESSVSATLFRLGLGGGLHMFLTDSLSFDPALEFAYNLGSITEEATGSMPLEWDVTGFNIALFAGLSGWLEL